MQAFEIKYANKLASRLLLFLMIFSIIWVVTVWFSDQSFLNKLINAILFTIVIRILYGSWKNVSSNKSIVIINEYGILRFDGKNYENFRWEDIIRTRINYEKGEGTFLHVTTHEKDHRINLNWTNRRKKDIETAINTFRNRSRSE